jgi:hypothetical protein
MSTRLLPVLLRELTVAITAEGNGKELPVGRPKHSQPWKADVDDVVAGLRKGDASTVTEGFPLRKSAEKGQNKSEARDELASSSYKVDSFNATAHPTTKV